MTGNLRLAVATLLVLAASAALSQNLSFLNKGPISKLSGEERDMLQATWRRALDNPEIGQRQEWLNPETGNGGWVEVIDTDEAFETTCHTVRAHTQAGGLEGGGRYRLCRAEDGSWRFASPVEPPASTGGGTR